MIRSLVPWWARIGLKLALSAVPMPYAAWKALRLFEHGAMEKPDYALRCFRQHHEAVGSPRWSGVEAVLELGPGDSVCGAQIARAHGAGASWLVDAGDFATTDLRVYRAMAELLDAIGHAPVSGWSSRSELLAACGANYLTEGTSSLARIPDASVDFAYSHAVLEHVPRAELPTLFSELRRVARPGSLSSHQVDLRDHLGGGLNNLRVGSRAWESRRYRTAGFYTNRARREDYLRLIGEAGFEVIALESRTWESVPIARNALAPEFRHYSDDELRVQGFSVVLRAP